MTDPRHIPVLLDEVLHTLAPRPGQTVVDATAGLGGHALALARRLEGRGVLVLNDLDPVNLREARRNVHDGLAGQPTAPRILAIHGPFGDLPAALSRLDLAADILLADLGFASSQMDDPARGFAFSTEGPLDMRLDPSAPVSAADLVNHADERELARIIREFGEEPQANRIARKIVAARRHRPISTTSELADVVSSALPPRRGPGIHPATRTFQAVRIAVNDELGQLDTLLGAIERAAERPAGWLAPRARLGVISFHSLEDRRVKQAFGRINASGRGRLLTRGAARAGDEELDRNRRARSARFRAIELTEPRAARDDRPQ